MLAQSFAFRGTVNLSRILPGKATPQKALSGMGWDGHAAGVVPGMALMGIKSGSKTIGRDGGQAASPAFSWLLPAGGAGLGELVGGWELPAAQGGHWRAQGHTCSGLYLERTPSPLNSSRTSLS